MTKTKKKKQTFKIGSWIVIMLVAVFLYAAYILFAPNVFTNSAEKSYLCIPENSTYTEVVHLLENQANVLNESAFKQVSSMLHYGERIRAGRYELKASMNNFQLVRLLRSGMQAPVRLTFNNIRTKEQLAARLSMQLMADSVSILKLLNDPEFLANYKLNPATSVSLFIPNTYEVFWNMNAAQLFERMNKEYTKFWTDERKGKAAAISLTPVEVGVLASIVEEETNNKADRPKVAGLYLNRLKKAMPLQADPTLKFAVGDFSLKRIGIKQILFISPYNTYRNQGLPPGPIRVASESGIDAVLNYVHHDYIYMCASETLNGEHKFATNWAEHLENAKKYQKKLNDLNIH